ncbi:ectonucleoside triphosphate diphosphohydrolase 5 isoform X2 [Brachyhypopomus gauderio]|uniref:ectonucleoside triphosphate diphosphohydrolase 5 isoform X2 n=1 Tax=Brachyhypopomus gauderio TaxID=698409 RepID=UPI004041EA21
MASMSKCPVLPLLFLWILVRDSKAQGYVSSGLDFAASFGSMSSSVTCPANTSQIFYGIMFDGGSTGTRIHVYTFIQKDPDGLPNLDAEMFDAVKPGLSAYADKPEYVGQVVRRLLKVAENTVPRVAWKQTPLVFKATAGLRLLPPAKAHALLEEVQKVFDESPFYVPADGVSMLNGTSEGILAWVTLNFLTGHLYPKTEKTVGILDLGGGSTQITFLPNSKKTIESAPADYTARFDVINTTYELYTHSYLGLGIKAARLAALGAVASEGLEQKVFKTSCLPKQYKGKFSFGGLTYKVSGISEGNTAYKLCYQEIVKVVKGLIQQPYELKDSSVFYAFSYYFDHAVEANLIDKVQGGTVQVRNFKIKAKEDGYGFSENAALELTKKVNSVEASWALGATISYFEHMKIL